MHRLDSVEGPSYIEVWYSNSGTEEESLKVKKMPE